MSTGGQFDWGDIAAKPVKPSFDWDNLVAKPAEQSFDWEEIGAKESAPEAPAIQPGATRGATIGPRKPGFLERIGNIVRPGLASEFDTRTVYHPGKQGPKQLLSPAEFMSETEQKKHPMITGAAEAVGGLTTGENLALIAATGGLGGLPGVAGRVLPRIAAAGFSGMMLKGMYDQFPELKNAWDKNDEPEVLRIVTHLIVSGAFAAMAGQHAATGKAPPLRPRYTRGGKMESLRGTAKEALEKGDYEKAIESSVEEAALRGRGGKSVAVPPGKEGAFDWGEFEAQPAPVEAKAGPVQGEAGTLYSNPLVPLSEAYTRLIGRPMWEKGVGLLWRMTPDFIQKAVRERPELIKERTPSGEKYVEARGETRGFIAEKFEKGFELGERLTGKIGDVEQRALGRMITGKSSEAELVRLRSNPKLNDAVEAAKEARTEFDALGSQAVVQGLLGEETFFQNYGKYMPRMYRKFELDYEKISSAYGEKKPTRLERSRFLKREDIPEHVRMLMGEILEPGLPVAKGIAQIGHDVGNARLFKAVAENPEWSGKTLEAIGEQGRNPADFVKMPETKKLGELSGQYVDKWIADDLNQIIRSRTEMQKISDGLIGEWKFSKVVLNPSTHARNMMSNTILAHLGGLPMTRVDIFYKGLKELTTKGELFQEAKAASHGRLAHGTFAKAEFDTLLDSWNGSKGGVMDRIASMRKSLAEGKPSEALRGIRPSQTKIGRKLGDLYQAEEQWFKMSKYIHNKEKGMSPKEAWADAEKWLFDYGEVSKMVEWSRRSPIGAPFITFTAKALPVVMESAVTAPWRIGSIIASLYYLNQAAAKSLGMSEKKLEEFYDVLPERMKGTFAGTRKFMLLPFKDKYEQIQLLDLTYILPWGDIGEQGGGLARQLPIVGSPLIQAVYELWLNKSAFTGKEIYHPWESREEITKKISLYLYRQIAPSLAPGGYGETRLRKAITKEPDYAGRTSSLPTAAASTLLGLKVTPIDPRMQKIYRRSEKNRTIREIEMQIGKVRRNRGLSASEKSKEIRRLKRIQFDLKRNKK